MTIQEVKQKYQAQWLALPGVVSVGLGSSSDGEAVIIIGLDGEHPEYQDQIPDELHGFTIQKRIIGKMKVQ